MRTGERRIVQGHSTLLGDLLRCSATRTCFFGPNLLPFLGWFMSFSVTIPKIPGPNTLVPQYPVTITP